MRARNVKPGFFTNPLLVQLPMEARLLFQGLWLLADREGRLEDEPLAIKMHIFPHDAVDVEALLQALHDIGQHLPLRKRLIVRYQRDGEAYITIVNFAKHQNPHMREAASVIPPYVEETRPQAVPAPPPPEHQASTVLAPAVHHTSPALSGIPSQESSLPSQAPEGPGRAAPREEREELGEAQDAPGDFQVRLGLAAGKRLRECSDDDLRWLATTCRRDDHRQAAQAYLRARSRGTPSTPLVALPEQPSRTLSREAYAAYVRDIRQRMVLTG